jgi:hypothetical protein
MHDDSHEVEFGTGREQMANDLIVGNMLLLYVKALLMNTFA